MSYEASRDLFFEVGEAPVQGKIRIASESVQQQQAYLLTGVIIDWFEKSSHLPVATGIIRSQHGERFSFTEREVVSGEPKVGHKVSFEGHPGGNLFIPEASKVVVDPQTTSEPQPKLETQFRSPEPEIRQLVERTLRQIPPVQPEEMYGTVIFYGDGTQSGFIEADGVRYKFAAADVIMGVPTQGSAAKFWGMDGKAVSVEIA